MVLQDSPTANIPDQGISCKDMVPSGTIWDRAARKSFRRSILLTKVKLWDAQAVDVKAAKREKILLSVHEKAGCYPSGQRSGCRKPLQQVREFHPGRRNKRGRPESPDGRLIYSRGLKP
jgi:hypothetical protein